MEFDCDPTEITEMIGIVPTKIWRKGEPVSTLSPRHLHKENGWQLSVASDDAWDYGEQLDTLLAMMQPRIEEFAVVSNQYYCELCWVVEHYRSPEDYRFPNPHITKDQLRVLSHIGATIGFDVYIFDADEPDHSPSDG